MRVALAFFLVATSLAGCAEDKPIVEADDDAFSDFELGYSDTTGIIRGVVVDGTIVPVEGVTVRVIGKAFESVTDDQGRFGFGNVPAGTHFLNFTSPFHAAVEMSVIVEANEPEPSLVKVQMMRLFDQAGYVEDQQITGYMNCGFSAGLSGPCVIDYTQVLPICPGGCVQELYGITGDVRRFVIPIENGWQSRINEMVWEPNLGTSQALSMTVSFFNRTTSHSYDGTAGTSPVRHQMDMDPELTHPDWIPPEGLHDYLVFVNPSTSGSGLPVALMVEQRFEMFVNTFYYGMPPEGWSFVAGDSKPF